ncbi:MAG: alpha/beta hydrolase [Clostridia bacterium]|nr:alpha/beta hydrolase [Clostridia bacterium]
MLYNAKNSRLPIGDTYMDYISFGKGRETLIILPGLGDGLKTVKGTALPFAFMYRKFAKKYKVYVFSRKNELKEGCTTEDMADDLKIATDYLGIEKAHILGVSMGGMIAQHFAIKYPEKMLKLILAVTVARSNDMIKSAINNWLDMVNRNDHKSLMIDNVERIYTEKYIKKKHYRMMYPLVSKISKPKTYDRFIIQANACLTHDAYDKLDTVTCPTLVIAGMVDKVVGGEQSTEPAALIKGSKCIIHHELGHGLYEEDSGFNDDVLLFLA